MALVQIIDTPRVTWNELHLTVQDGGAGERISVGDKFEGEHRWLDASSLASRCLHQIQTDQNFDDLLEPLTPLELGAEELRIASCLVGKNYSNIQIYEISEYGGYDPFPYFTATSAGISYGSEGMGRGELALLLTYWTLRDLPPKSILILEEPETHVSPRSQDCLMNVVAKFCDERSIWVIVTTHSPTVIRRIPKEHLKLLARSDGQASCLASASKLDVALLLGGGVAYNGVILVEDIAALRFVHALIETLAPEILRQFEIVVAGSDSNITGILRSMPLTRSWLALVGAYDGDMRSRIDGTEFKWPFAFLPGDTAPEHLLIALTESTLNVAQTLATELGKPLEQVTMALNHVTGVDHHDYFGQFALALNIEESLALRGFVRLWLQNTDNKNAAEEFIEDLRGATRGPLGP